MVLYLRDAAGLGRYVLPEPDLPPLEPVVPPRRHDVDLRLAIREWERWWTRTVRSPRSMPPPRPPEWVELADLPAMRALAEQHVEDFWIWMGTVRNAELERQQSGDSLHLTHFVNGFEEKLGRPVRPFVLTMTELPLAGAGGWVLDPNHVLISTQLSDDASALRTFLQPVVQALA